MKKLSGELKQMSDCGDFSRAMEDLPPKAQALEEEIKEQSDRIMSQSKEIDKLRGLLEEALENFPDLCNPYLLRWAEKTRELLD